MIEQPGFFVWNPERAMPRMRHATYHEALVEAERLARLSPGENFFVMGAMERIKIPLPGTEREIVRPPQEFACRIDPAPF